MAACQVRLLVAITSNQPLTKQVSRTSISLLFLSESHEADAWSWIFFSGFFLFFSLGRGRLGARIGNSVSVSVI